MWIRFSGLLGLVIFLFGFVGALLSGLWSQPVLVLHMTAGLMLIFFWLFTSGTKNFSEARQALKGRGVRFGANALLYSAVFIGFLGVIYYLALTYDRRWDLTESGVYSLAPQTEKVLSNLKLPLKITAFKGISQVDENALEDLLDLYEYGNSKMVNAELVDARTKPFLLERYEMKPGNLIYLEYGEGDAKSVSRINEDTEQALTNAIIKLTRGAAKKIYYVIGHDEPDLKSDEAQGVAAFAAAIGDEHLTVEELLLSQSPEVPEDTAAIILCAPKKPLLNEEIELLKKYADGGGRLLLFAEPRSAAGVRDLAAHFAIEVGNDVVIDQVQRLFSAPALGAQPIVRQYGAHPITRNMKADDVTIFNIASSVRPNAESSADALYTELAKTGSTAWAEKDLARLFDSSDPSAEFQQGVDSPGPVTLGVAYEKNLGNESAAGDQSEQPYKKAVRVVVFGDSDWILNANIGVYANRDFALSALNWIVGEEGGISIGKKSMRMSDAPMTRQQFGLLLTAGFVVPELILVVGLYIWFRRKHAHGA